MAKFRILKPVAVTRGETVTHHRIPGEVVEIADKEAEPLLAQERIEPVADGRPAAAEVSEVADKPRPRRG